MIHGTADVGRAKVDSARDAVAALDPDIRVVTHRTRLTSANVDAILRGYDVVVDGTDNFPTRYLVNDACVRLGAAGGVGVGAAVRRADHRVLGARTAPQLRDLFPEPPAADEVPSCAEAGVLGALCGQVGSVMATEVVKLVTGTGESLLGRVLVIDALRGRWSEVPLRRRRPGRRPPAQPESPAMSDGPDHHRPRARRPAGRPRGRHRRLPAHRRARARGVRRRARSPGRSLVPLGSRARRPALAGLPRDQEIVVQCQVGGRSLTAARVLRGPASTRATSTAASSPGTHAS